MNRRKLVVVLILVVAAGCVQSTARKPEQPEANPTQIAEDALAVAKGNNAFATDLYARLSSGKPGNLFFSPYSISVALAMTDAGAKGETEAQMTKVLHFPVPEARLHPAFNALREKMAESDKAGFQLRVANRLWGQKGCHFLPEFLAITRANYGAELGLLDFEHQSEAARQTINAWIAEQTDDKIQDLLAAGVLGDDTRLVLTNAIYFKAPWTQDFNKSATKDAPFHISDAEQTSVPMMYQMDDFRYGKSDDVQVLELPYGPEGSLSMLVLLPSKIGGLADLEKRLTGENLEKWSKGLEFRPVEVYLPRFKLTSEFSLGDVLASLGMPLAFSDEGADFSRMSTERLFISAVVHKAFVDVNEAGTEAAAATAVDVKAAADPGDELALFRADHPLVFLIRDNRTQSILFLGRLANPKD